VETTDEHKPSFWRDTWPLWALGAFNVALHMAFAGGYGIFRDELYYLVCSQRLDWGYVDHPPLSIVLLAIQRAILGDSLYAIRFLPSLAAGFIVVLFGLIARELGAGRFGQVLASLTALVMPVYHGMSSFYSMNSLDVLVWCAIILVVCRIVASGNPRLWLLVGALAGIGLQNKFSVAFLGFALVAGLALTRHRKHFSSPYLYVGGAIALLIFLPHLIWMYRADWITFEFMRNAAKYKNTPTNPLKYFADQLLMAHPFALPLWLGGMAYCLFPSALRPYRLFAIMFISLFALFSLTNGKAYYLAPAYGLVVPAGALAVERLLGRPRTRWIRGASAAVLIAGGAITAPLALPILPPETLMSYEQALGITGPKEEVGHTAKLGQHFADRFGWPELAAAVAEVFESLEPDEKNRCAIVCSNYGQAAAIDRFGRDQGLPYAISGHNNYWLWGPRGASGDVVIAVGGVHEGLQELFEEGREVAHAGHPYAIENDVPIWLFRRMKPGLTVEGIWANARELI
jgi:4-amino-4-deoxy-L-arabinose transferase-like glycosyltransferase